MSGCDFNDFEKVNKMVDYFSKWYDIKAVVSFVDPYCALATKIAQMRNLSNFSYLAYEKMQNKLLSRQVLDNTKYNPNYKIVDKSNYKNYDEISKMLPVVIKYIESNGSRDVYFCKDLYTYKKYLHHLFSQFPKGILLVEEFIDGPQYIVEAVAINKKIIIEAIIEQEIRFMNDHFIITGYSLVLDYPKKFYTNLKTAVDEILEIHKLENGPCHLEIRCINDEWKLIEINPRISGAGMNQFIQIGLGYSLVEEHLKLALNMKTNFKPRLEINAFAEYIILSKNGILERITGRSSVLDSEGVKYVYVKPKKGTYLTTPVSLGNRYAYIIATGTSKEKAKLNAKNAAMKMKFHLM
ncbi:MAG: ATP-grasp domain-containing protein [Bacilli bacterium]|nr:ATP-grasp domain-containing protein [Bacilli bacterium]